MAALAACESPARPAAPPLESERTPPAAPEVMDEVDPDADPRVAEAAGALHAGDLERARELTTQLLLEEKLSEGVRLFAEGRPREALPVLDDAIELDPRSAEAWFARGRAAFETAPDDAQAQFFYADAQHSFERAAQRSKSARDHLWASRAARMAGDRSAALDHARKGVLALGQNEPPEGLDRSPERILAEAAFDRYVELRQAENDASELFRETEDQLARLLGDRPDDPWPWLQLANLYQWEGRLDDALATLERGLAVLPASEDLHNRGVAVAREAGGRERVFEVYERFRESHPDVALGVWYPAVETFERALERYQGGEDAREDFAEAERAFRACREQSPEYADACIGYEVMCRAGVAWCQFQASRGESVTAEQRAQALQSAKAAFLSMEDLKEGGLTWQIEGRLGSGIQGLEFLLLEYSQDPMSVQSMVNAAAIADYLHVYLPDSADQANNAGFFNRDAAVLLEIEALRAASRAEEETDSAKSRELDREAERLRARATELMTRSYDAYKDAVRLNPDDVRVVNDTGLVMVYYLRSDVEAGEHYLRRAVSLGEEQLAETTLEGEDLLDLKEALGDAYQNLGVLHLTLKNDPAAARPFFEKSLEIGPYPRVQVEQVFLPACDGNAEALTRISPPEIWNHERN